MAVAESCRLAGALREEGVPLHTIVINQVGSLSPALHPAKERFLSNRPPSPSH